MKIAIVRGDFLSSWEIPNFAALLEKNDVTMFLGEWPVYKVELPPKMKLVTLFSLADLNFGKISRWKMAILNRLFVDAHVLFGLEEKLKGFDVVYIAETFYKFCLQAVRAKQKGYVRKVCCHAGENIPFNNEGIWGRRQLKQEVIAGVDRFVAVTETAKEVLLAEGCDPEKIVRAQPGVDLALFRPISLKKDEKIKLLFVGRLIEEKGIRDVIRVFTKLHKKYPMTELVVVGSGPLSEIVTGEGIIYRGAVPHSELPKIYSSADIYVHYSKGSETWLEQYGFTLLEAMACGLPVVGLDRGSVKEIVGNAGLVVSKNEYAKTLETLVCNKNQRLALSKRALSFARENYDAYKYGQTLEKIFKSA